MSEQRCEHWAWIADGHWPNAERACMEYGYWTNAQDGRAMRSGFCHICGIRLNVDGTCGPNAEAIEAQALEIAARELVERSMGCPFEFYDWQRCPAGGETSSNVCGIPTMKCWRDWLLQQARDFFERQARQEGNQP